MPIVSPRNASGPPCSGGDFLFKDKTLLPGQGHAWEAHDHAVVTLVVHGRLDETFASRNQRCPGWELHYKPRGATHATSTGPDGVRMLLVGLRGASLEGLEPGGGAIEPRLLGGGARAARALSAVLRIERALKSRSPVDRDAIRSLWASLRPAPGPAAGDTATPSWLTEVRERIVSQDGARTRLSPLAAEFRVHPVYLARAFRKFFRCSVGHARRQARVNPAQSVVSSVLEPISELSITTANAIE